MFNKTLKNIPEGIRLVSWATAMRYIGWGSVEGLLPIFLYSFSKSYFGAGFLSSIYDIVFILSLPFVGMLSDRIAGKKTILLGLMFYPFIGLSYFIAGVTSMVLFVIIARIMNGLAYALDLTGRNTYFRRHSSFQNASAVFGYFETVTNFWWMAAMITSIWLLSFVKIHVLFLLLIPTVSVAIFMILKLKPEKEEKINDAISNIFNFSYFTKIFSEIKKWNKSLKTITAATFLLAFIDTIIEFIIPIYMYKNGASIQYVIFIAVLLTIPNLFSFYLGKFLDKKREFGIGLGVALIAILLLSFPFVNFKLLQILVLFGIGTAYQMVVLGCNGIITLVSSSEQYGIVSSVMSAVTDIGNILGMIVLGYIVDKNGLNYGIGFALLITILLFIIFRVTKKP